MKNHPTEMVIQLKDIVDNYKTNEDIIAETDNDIKNVLDFFRFGQYEFVHCGFCGGPRLGHKSEKCRQLNNERYDDELVRAFEDKIKTIYGFRKLVKKYREIEDEKENRMKVKELEASVLVSVRTALEHYMRKEVEPMNQTTQLVKSRYPPIWSGQSFDRWKT